MVPGRWDVHERTCPGVYWRREIGYRSVREEKSDTDWLSFVRMERMVIFKTFKSNWKYIGEDRMNVYNVSKVKVLSRYSEHNQKVEISCVKFVKFVERP